MARIYLCIVFMSFLCASLLYAQTPPAPPVAPLVTGVKPTAKTSSQLAQLAHALQDTNVKVRRQAVSVLGDIKEEGATDLLLTALRDSDKVVRRKAIESLAGRSEERVAIAVGAFATDRDSGIQSSAGFTLSTLATPTAFPPLLKVLTSIDPKIYRQSVETLSHVHSAVSGFRVPVSLPLLLSALKTADPRHRPLLVPLLASTQEEGVVKAIISALKDSQVIVRQSLLSELREQWYGDSHAFQVAAQLTEALLNATKDTDSSVRAAATETLVFLDDADAIITRIVALLHDPDPKVRLAAVDSLDLRNKPEMVPSLLIALSVHDSAVRQVAVSALGRIGDWRAIAPLRALWSGADGALRLTIVNAFSNLHGVGVTATLLERSKDADARVRAAAIGSLGNQRGELARNALVAALRDDDAQVRKRALTELAMRRDPQGLETLLAQAGDTNSPDHTNAFLLLRWYDDPRIADVVRKAMQSPDSKMRRRALSAVGNEARSWRLDILLAAATDADFAMRREVADKICIYEDPRAEQAMLSLLRDPDSRIRLLVLSGFSGDRPAAWAVPAICDNLTNPDAAVRESAARALARIGDPRAVQPLLDDFAHAYISDQQDYIDQLFDLADMRVVEPLLASYRTGDKDIEQPVEKDIEQQAVEENIKQQYVESIEQNVEEVLAIACGDPKTVPLLLAALDDPVASVRRVAFLALPWPYLPTATLVKMLADTDPQIRLTAAQRLAARRDSRAIDSMVALLQQLNTKIKQQPLSPLGALLQQSDQNIKQRTLSTLGTTDDPRAIKALRALLPGAAQPDRTEIEITLGQLHDPQAVLPLFSLLCDMTQTINLRVLGEINEIHLVEQPHFPTGLPEEIAQARQVLASLAKNGTTAMNVAVAALRDPEPKTRSAAVLVLRYLCDTRTLPFLCAKLSDENPTVCLLAARALRDYADVRSLATLLKSLKTASPDLRAEIARTLGAIGDARAFPPLRDMLQNGTPDEQFAATYALGQIADASMLPDLLAVLHGPQNPDVRGQAAWALGQIGDKQAIIPLIVALQDAYSEVYWKAALALKLFDDTKATDAIQTLLKESYALEKSKHYFDYPLLSSNKHLPIRELIARLTSTHGMDRSYIVIALGESGNAAVVEPLLALLSRNHNSALTATIVEALGKLKDPRAVDPLLAMLKTVTIPAIVYQDIPPPELIAWALGEIGDPRASTTLLAMLDSIPSSNQGAILLALGKLGCTAAAERMLIALQDNEPQTRASAARALGFLKEVRAIQPLLTALADTTAPWPSPKDFYLSDVNWMHSVRAQVAWALGEISDAAAVEPLINALQIGDMYDRQSAAEALGKLQDQRAIQPLINALDTCTGQAKKVTVTALRNITGQDYGEDATKWRTWLGNGRR